MKFDGFDWDEANWPNCGKHGLSKPLMEDIFEFPVTLFDDPLKDMMSTGSEP